MLLYYPYLSSNSFEFYDSLRNKNDICNKVALFAPIWTAPQLKRRRRATALLDIHARRRSVQCASNMALSIALTTANRLSYFLLILLTGFLALASCVFLLSQAVRTAPNRDWRNNFNALVIGAMYILIVSGSLEYACKERG